MRRTRGMTMIEVLVALLVATVGLLGGLAMIGSLISGSAYSRHASEAQVLAQTRLEQLQSLTGVTAPPNALVPADTGPATPAAPVFVGEQLNVQGGVTQPIDVNGTANNPAAAMKMFWREVAWQTNVDMAVTLPRRVITVKVCWSEGQVLTASCNTFASPPSGYHEVIVSGVRLP